MTQKEMFGNADFVGAKECQNTDILVLKGSFSLSRVKKATLRVLGLGFFHCFINGARVGTDLFLPLSSEYEPRENFPTNEKLSDFRTYVPEYDVTSLLKDGENTITVHFGGGWYTFEQSIKKKKKKYGDPKAIWRLFGECDEGNFDFGSSERDQITKSFITDYRFDRFEVHDFTKPDPILQESPETVWENAVLVSAPATKYEFSDCPADAVMETLPITLLKETATERIYDCGKNTSGWPVLRLLGKRGETVRVLMGEELGEDGLLDPKLTHKQEFICTCDGTERETHALFTWFGFRFFSVQGPAEPISVESVHTRVVRTSDFSCDNEILNWLHGAFLNTQLANMHAGIPSDCPHIERRGYTGDGHLAGLSAMKMLDTEAFYRKWMQDIADSQDVLTGHIQNTAPYTHSGGGLGGWGCAIVEIPWQFYQHFGDTAPLAKYYPNMLRYFDYLELHSERELVTTDKAGEWCLGDWCCPTSVVLPAPFVNTYFYIKSLTRCIQIAQMLHKNEDIPLFKARIAAKTAAIKSAYFNTWDGNFFGGVQGANAFALDLGLGDERTWRNLLSYYENLGEFDTGIFGTELLLRVLFERGAAELAVKLLTSKKVHTFAEMRARGATTIWEHWPESYRDRSHSHPMFGAVISHLYTYLLGIRQIHTPNGEHLVIEPAFVPQLSRVCGFRTVKAGRVSVSYEKKGNEIALCIELPQGAIAVLRAFGREFTLPRGGVARHVLSIPDDTLDKAPEDGDVISLQTSAQKEFIADVKALGIDQALTRLAARKEDGEELSFPRTVSFPFPHTKKFELAEDADFLTPFPTQFNGRYYEAKNLKADTAYFWRMDGGDVHTFRTTAEYPRFLHVDGLVNVRDMGSEVIRQGLVYRGTDLDRNFILSRTGKEMVARTLGIRTEIDLRLNSAIINYCVSAAGDEIDLHVIPYFTYAKSFEEPSRTNICRVMELFANEDAYPIYLHCTGGADRTGVIVFFLRALCGEEEEALHLDYELTGLSNYGAAVMEGVTDSLRSRNSAYYREFLEKLATFAPGKPVGEQVQAFLLNCGVSAETLTRIRAILMK